MNKSLLGVAVVAACIGLSRGATAQELVTNGGFETGDFTGWTQGGDLSFTSVASGGTGIPHSGTFFASLGPVNTGTLTQTLATTPGQAYTISYWLRNSGGTQNNFTSSFNGVGLETQMNIAPAGPYVQSSFTATATSTSTSLEFDFDNPPAWLNLDDVSVTPTGVVPGPSALMVVASGGLTGLGLLRRRRTARK